MSYLADLFNVVFDKFVAKNATVDEINPEAKEALEKKIPDYIRNIVPNNYSNFSFIGSSGRGSAANVPWIAILNPSITKTTQKGYYVVLLFSADMQRCYLTLNQGFTDLKKRFTGTGSQVRKEARSIALDYRRLLNIPLEQPEIKLACNRDLARGYEAGNVFSYCYEKNNLPTEIEFKQNLSTLLIYYDRLVNLLENKSDQPMYTPYTVDDLYRDAWIDHDQLDDLLHLIKSKQNVILQGPPGVGKTFIAKRLAYALMGVKDDSRIKMIQFHQSYSYEDFIMGYKPSKDGFELRSGVFYDFCQQATKQPEKDFFFIIDEINRGNLSKILGELMMLIERDHRGESLTLAYDGQSFCVPKNVYLIGMMNTADRSLALIDYALRRRFSFFEIAPGFDSDGFKEYQASLGNDKFNDLIATVRLLNESIVKDDSLGSGFQIAHSYFCKPEDVEDIDQWLKEVVQYDLLPTLSEYWFDEHETLKKWKDKLLGVVNGS